MGSMSVLPEIRLPVILIVLFGGLGVAALIALYRRNRQVRATAEEQFRSFREQAVGLMDQIDALRSRHKTLPETDPDFVEPMTGATRELYDRVAADLDRLWERWLAVMEVWNRAEARIKSTSTFSVRPSEEARELLSAGRLEDLLRDSSACKSSLDRLNLAHEVASKSLKDARREAAAFARKFDRGGPSGGEADLYSRELRLVDRDLDDAEKMMTADPIGASERVAASLDALADLREPAREPATHRRPRQRPGYDPSAPTRTILDDLTVAAGRLQELGSKIRVLDILRLVIKGWVALWVLGLFLAFLPALMPMIFLFMIFVVFGSGFRVFQQVAAPTVWYWDSSSRRGPRRLR